MTIPFFEGTDKFPIPLGFDDPWEQQTYYVQQFLGQLGPRTLDGGRQVLWRCSKCHQPWMEKSTSSREQLSEEQSILAAFHVQAKLHLLPKALCPECSRCELGGVLRVEEGIANVPYYRFIWRASPYEQVQILQILMMDARQLSDVWNRHDLQVPHQLMTSWPTDLLLSRVSVQFLVHMLSTFALPEPGEISPLDAAALAQEARRVSLPPLDLALRGYLCHPRRLRVLLDDPEDDVLFSVVEGKQMGACDPQALVAWWQRLLARYSRWI